MCNLYKLNKSAAEVAKLFRSGSHAVTNAGAEVYPGYPGLVIAQGHVRSMAWGFPLVLKGRNGQPLKPKPVNNAREDKLHTPFWRSSFERRRCLIPISAWAEAEGEKGSMTRTWYSLPNDEPFAVAGIWRPTDDWGDAYSMVMTDGCPQMAETHDRMPVILTPDTYAQWQDGDPADALQLCRPYAGTLAVDRTSERWAHRR